MVSPITGSESYVGDTGESMNAETLGVPLQGSLARNCHSAYRPIAGRNEGQCAPPCFDLNLLSSELSFDADVADAPDQIIGGGFSFFHGQYFDGIGLVVGAQDQVVARDFDVLHGAVAVFRDRVHVELAFAVGLQGVVVAVEEDGGARQ